MSAYGYLLEIEGIPFVIASSANAPVSTPWVGATVYSYRCKQVVSAPIRCDFLSGSSETGGGSFWAANVGTTLSTYLLTGRKRSPVTRATANLMAGLLDLDVEDTSAFPATGYLYLGHETMYYAGKTGVDFTIDVGKRGLFGSEDRDHKQYGSVDGGLYPRVYGFPPSLGGRRCWVWRYEFYDPTFTKTQMFGGFVEDLRWHPDGSLEFILKSSQCLLQEAQVCAAPYASGTVYFRDDESPNESGWCEVKLDNPDIPFPDPAFNRTYAYFRYTGEGGRQEIIGYFNTTWPAYSVYTAAIVSTGTLLDVVSMGDFQVGDVIDIDTAPPQRRTITELLTAATQFRLSAPLFPDTGGAGAEIVECVSRQRIVQPMKYGGADLPIAYGTQVTWKPDTKVEEIRYLDGSIPDGSGGSVAGTDLDILLQVLTSRNGDQTNGNYDVLPPGWGLGISTTWINLTAFQSLAQKGRGGPRHYLLAEPLDLSSLLKWYSWCNACYFYMDRSGLLSCAPLRTLYPGDAASLDVTVDHLDRKSLTEMTAQEARVKNAWTWKMARPAIDRSKDPTLTLNFANPDSIDLYDVRAMPEFDDPGGDADLTLQACVATEIVWSRYGQVCPRYTFTIPLHIGYSLEPGMLITLTCPNVPDCAGGTGLTEQTCEVISVVPKDEQNGMEVEAEPIWTADYGLVAPCMKATFIEPVAQTFVAMARAVTFLSQVGTEDSDHFQAGDPVWIWKASTLGTGAEVNAPTTITAIDYVGRVVTLAAMPLWMSAGDLILPEPWPSWAGRNTSPQTLPVTVFEETFVALADEANTPPDLSGDAAFRLGG